MATPPPPQVPSDAPRPEEPLDDDAADLMPELPPVVAVVVACNPGEFLEEGLRSLGAQDYSALSVLVVDAGSDHDPTERVAAALPGAFVRRVAGEPGFGGAANEALQAVTGATFILLCHDDVALDPSAVRVMVEEAYRSNAAIVGPKIVSAENPDVLLDVGRSIDRLGGSHTGIEPGEIDQEQHDAVRDVFYVSSAAMLVRADLFEEIGGFDPDTFPGSEDLDLCWRARLVGARVMVAPDARARHLQVSEEGAAKERPNARDSARTRVRVVLTSYSAGTLMWVVPLALVVAGFESVLFAFSRRRRSAFAGLRAWSWNLLHFGRLRAARRRAQALRHVSDADLRELQVGTSTRAGTFLSAHHADERVQSLGDRGRETLESIGDVLRHPASGLMIAFLALLALGSRELFSHGVPAVGTLASWPSARALLTELDSAWRHTGLGSTAAPPPVLAMMGGLDAALFGATGLARTVLVVGAYFVGTLGMFRLGRALDGSRGAAAVSALVYGVVPLPRNAIANGRLGPLVVYALAPFTVALLVRAARFMGTSGASRRPLLGLAMVTAITAAWYPPALVLPIGIGLVWLVTVPLAGGGVAALRSVGVALVGVVGAMLLLVPWTATFADVRDDPAAFGLAFRWHLDLVDVARFQTGPAGAGIAVWGLVAAAAAALVLADGSRLAWAIRGWGLVVAGYAATYLPSRLAPDAATVVPEAGLVLAALGLAIAAGVTAQVTGEHVTRARLGWRSVCGVLALGGVVLGGLGFVGDVLDGRWRAPGPWEEVLSFTRYEVAAGEFRILWVGDAAVLPLDPVEVDAELAYSITRNGPGDAREFARAPVTEADDVISRALRIARSGRTSRLGRVLAPAGIRYVALTLRNGSGGTRGRVPAGIPSALADQLDLARLGSEPGLVLYENQSWAPARAMVPEGVDVPAGSVDPLESSVAVDLAGAPPLTDRQSAPGTVLLAERFDAGWSASAGGEDLSHDEAFGFTNSWALPERAKVELAHDGQAQRGGLLALEAAVWVFAITWWGRGRRRESRVRERRDREERRRAQFDFADFDDDDFWERG